MLTIDANILLRYAPNDNAKLSAKAQEIIESNTCYVPLLALAGMGFVLGLVYEAKPAEVVAYAKSLMQQKNLRLSTKAAYFKPWQGLKLAWIGLTRCFGLQHLYKTS